MNASKLEPESTTVDEGPSTATHDVVVIGGGPAGASAARLLASWGYSVAMLAGRAAFRPPAAESLPPSIRKPLTALGLRGTVERAGFLETTGNTSAWAGRPLTAVPFAAGDRGYQVRRDHFDAVLREAAGQAGVQVIHGTAREIDALGGAGRAVRWTGTDGRGQLRGRWVLDASGRSGVMARTGLRTRYSGPGTLAISARWRADRWKLPDPSHTLVESFLEGWAWSVPISAESRHVAVMIEPRAGPIQGRADLERLYLEELSRAQHHARLLSSARRITGPSACTATPYAARRYDGDGFLLVGDAASFIDPLSSFGVGKALSSGWLAAVVVNTALRNPALEQHARKLFSQRERTAATHYFRLTAEFYAEAAAHHAHPFWTARAEATLGGELGDAPAAAAAEQLLGDPRVRHALHRLRASSEIRLRPSSRLSRALLPTVREREVVLVEHLVTPEMPEGIAFVGPVHLPHLLDLLPRYSQIPDLYDAWRRTHSAGELGDLLGALSLLLAYDLVHSD